MSKTPPAVTPGVGLKRGDFADSMTTRAELDDFTSLFEFLPIGAYRSTPGGRQLRANPAQVRLNGYDSEAEMLAGVRDIATEWYVEPTRRAEFWALLERDGFVRAFESEIYRHKTRERIWITENAHLVCDADGKVLFCEGTTEEITDRVLALEALARRERELSQIIDAVPHLIYAKDAAGHFRLANQATAAFYRAPVSQLMGRRTDELMHLPDVARRIVDSDNEVLRDGRKVVIGEQTVIDGAGERRIFNVTKLPFYFDGQGAMLGVCVDITQLRRTEKALQENSARLQLALTSARLALWDYDLRTGEVYLSVQWSLMMGGPAQPTETTFQALLELVPMEDRLVANRTMLPALRGDVAEYVVEHRVRRLDGSHLHIVSHGRVVERGPDGRALRAVGVNRDISGQREAELALREGEARWAEALESMGDGTWDWDIPSGISIYSRRLKAMYGYEEHEIPNTVGALDDLTHPEDVAGMERDRQAYDANATPFYSNEHRVRCKDGTWKWILSRGVAIKRDAQGKHLRVIGTHTDISGRKHSEAQVAKQANYDGLTGLPNRTMLRDRLAQGMLACRRDGTSLAVLFIDLDHFKEVNDALGHGQGDLLLTQAATRIRACVRDSDTVARMGGDEFVVVLSQLHGAEPVDTIAQNIIDRLKGAFDLGADQTFISASIGVAMFPADAQEVDDLLKFADQALYLAKGAGRACFRYFTPALQDEALTRMRLAADMHRALDEKQFHVVYQPLVELATGDVYKAEALIRWQHPERGAIGPYLFIPIAERSGLISQIGDWVFEQAAQQVLSWRQRFDARFQISVNKSPMQFHQAGDSQGMWINRLEQLGLPGRSVVVEITEGLLLDARAEVGQQLAQLRAADIPVAMDDFGTGYSSLSYLHRYDLDYLKIDQAFVRHSSGDAKNLALCKAIIAMAHGLGMKVVAEGVETEEQRAWLTLAGCDFGQGYLFAKPMSPADFETWLRDRPRSA